MSSLAVNYQNGSDNAVGGNLEGETRTCASVLYRFGNSEVDLNNQRKLSGACAPNAVTKVVPFPMVRTTCPSHPHVDSADFVQLESLHIGIVAHLSLLEKVNELHHNVENFQV